MPDIPIFRVVFAPDFLVSALTNSAGSGVLNLWRDGRIQPVVNRSLLIRYLRVLYQLGLPERLVRHWSWWFVSAEKCGRVSEGFDELNGTLLCHAVAKAAGAKWIIHGSMSNAPVSVTANGDDLPRSITGSDFLATLAESIPRT